MATINHYLVFGSGGRLKFGDGDRWIIDQSASQPCDTVDVLELDKTANVLESDKTANVLESDKTANMLELDKTANILELDKTANVVCNG